VNDLLRVFKAELFKAMGHPARLRILELLREADRSVTELQVAMEIEGSAVSQHLMVLRARQLVDSRREGANVVYAMRHHDTVCAILDAGREIFAAHLGQLQASLEADEPLAEVSA
jgi:ArsR family transcriptional regulator